MKLNTQSLKSGNRYEEDDLEDSRLVGRQLGYAVSAQELRTYTVYLDEDIVEPSYYRGVIQMLLQASENDEVIFIINSRGGRADSLYSLAEAVKSTDATTIAVLTGECASAASLFALHCNQVVVTDSATMLCHYVSYGYAGKGADIEAHVAHTSKVSKKLIANTYKNFLTEEEIDNVIKGQELYLDSDEIIERLKRKHELETQAAVEEVKPTRRSKKKET